MEVQTNHIHLTKLFIHRDNHELKLVTILHVVLLYCTIIKALSSRRRPPPRRRQNVVVVVNKYCCQSSQIDYY